MQPLRRPALRSGLLRVCIYAGVNSNKPPKLRIPLLLRLSSLLLRPRQELFLRPRPWRAIHPDHRLYRLDHACDLNLVFRAGILLAPAASLPGQPRQMWLCHRPEPEAPAVHLQNISTDHDCFRKREVGEVIDRKDGDAVRGDTQRQGGIVRFGRRSAASGHGGNLCSILSPAIAGFSIFVLSRAA